MARHTKRNAIIAGVAAAVAGLGITGAAAAQNGPSEKAGQAEEQQDPSFTGSVPAPQDGKGSESESKDDEAAEGKALQGLATVTPDEARAAALKAVPGTADEVELDNENGFVVYSVEVTGADVKVDAGDGRVLAQETGEESEAGEGPEAEEANEAPGVEQPEGSEPTPAG